MTKFILAATTLETYDAGNYSMTFDAIMHPVKKVVEADNLKALKPAFDAFVAEQSARGVMLMFDVRMAERGARKPAGFDKQNDRGGMFHVFANVDKSDYRPEEDGPDWGKAWSDTSAELA